VDVGSRYTGHGWVVKRDKRTRQYTPLRRTCTAFICGVIVLCGSEGCSPDLCTVAGALDGAASAREWDSARALFEVLDERSRAALYSISRDARAAARLIRADYPDSERAENLRWLGGAALAQDAADLFSIRCPAACRARLTEGVGAPVATRPRKDGAVDVTTARGGTLVLFRGQAGAWGLVWNTVALAQERVQISRELRQVVRNAATYRRRRALANAPDATLAVW
jgi:hypothetical protein